MKPSELAPLVGRKVEVFWNGQRTGQVVKIASSNVLVVKLAPPLGRHRIALSSLVGVHWRGRRISLDFYLTARGREASRKSEARNSKNPLYPFNVKPENPK